MEKPVTHKLVDTNMSDDVNPNYRSRKVLRDSQALKAVHDPQDKDVCLKHASSCSIHKAEILFTARLTCASGRPLRHWRSWT